MKSARVSFVAALALTCACTDPPAPPPRPINAGGALPSGVVARVGGTTVRAESVAAIARAQRIDVQAARDRAVRDALFAEEAKASGLDQDPAVASAITAVLARATLREIRREAEALGPVTDEELRVTTERHWLELDRPEGFRTVHAVVRLDDKADDAKRKAAAAVAEAIREAARSLPELGASTSAPPPPRGPMPPPEDALTTELRRIAKEVPSGGLEVLVEPLPPLAADGRALAYEGGSFDTAFAAAASRLSARGEVSPPVVTRFGVHVIVLLERAPAHVVPLEERRALVHDEVVSERARAAQERLLAPARAGLSVERSLDALLALVAVER